MSVHIGETYVTKHKIWVLTTSHKWSARDIGELIVVVDVEANGLAKIMTLDGSEAHLHISSMPETVELVE